MIYRTTLREGESMFDAICRAGYEANRSGCDSYSVDCSKCGEPLDEEHTPQQCDIIREYLL